MFAMTGRLAARIRRRPHSITRAVVPGNSAGHLAGYVGLMRADAFDGYNQLYKAQRKPAPILEAACWSHGRRKFVDLVKQGEAPIASEAVRRIDILFEIERSINGKTPAQRLAVRRKRSRPLVAELEIWMRQQRALLSTKNDTAKAINYLLNRWAAFTRFLDDGRVCLTNNAAERALRGVAVGRRNWTFAGSDAGGHRAAAVYTLIETCKMNDVDPQAWLADVLARLARSSRQQSRQPASLELEGEPRGQGRRCRLSASRQTIATAWGAGRKRTDEQMASAVKHQAALLLRRLGRHKPHVGSGDHFANRLCVSHIVSTVSRFFGRCTRFIIATGQ